MNRYLRELAATFGLLTRLPVWRLIRDPTPIDPARCVWAYPLVGACIGGLGGLAYFAATRIGLTQSLAAIWTLACLLLLTGALHEDGMADTADGFGGGRNAARKLEIMRDSRIGSYGTLALFITLAIRAAAIATLAEPLRVITALIAVGALSRAAMIIVLIATAPARKDGLSAALSQIPSAVSAVGLLLSLAIVAACLPPERLVPLVAITAIIPLAMARWAKRQIGGHTGDVLGATAVITECVLLSLLTL